MTWPNRSNTANKTDPADQIRLNSPSFVFGRLKSG